VTLVGQGFVIEAKDIGSVADAGAYLKPYVTGRSISQASVEKYVLDFYGLNERELRESAPAAYQWLFDHVKPERLQNNRESYRESWWVFAEPRSGFRNASADLKQVIVTPRTAKHRFFRFEPSLVQFESEVVGIAVDCSAILGVLSSAVHMAWVEANAASFGAYVGNIRYNQTRCFNPFPFPESVSERSKIRTHAEQLDTHRKRQQAAHPDLTLTGMYNVLDKLRSGESLTAKERTIHEHGLVSVLRQLHDELDAAVLDAYGWSDLLPLLRIAHGNEAPADGQSREDARRAFDDAILERLVALNAERAAEEARGLVRWLRPEFQHPSAHAAEAAPVQNELATDTEDAPVAAAAAAAGKPMPWPTDAIAQVRAVADVLAASPVALTLDEIAARFTARGAWKKRLPQLLEMLVALGRAHANGDRYEA
jgi:hypothetical protein